GFSLCIQSNLKWLISIQESEKRTMERDRRGFCTGEAAHITGIPYWTILHWARTRLITPSLLEAPGPGRNRLYSYDDVVALRIVRDLRDRGASVQSLRNIIKRLRKHGLNSPLEEAQLLVMGREVAIVNSPRAIENLLSEPGHLYLTPGMVLNLRKLIA